MDAITREERLLDGQDLEPITRKEMFIKRIYDKTQSIPEPITREEMFLKKAGEGSGDVTVEQLNVTENGTYSESGKAYSPVIVEVPIPPAPPTYLVKDVSNLPQSIATIDDAIVAPIIKLKAQIEAVQSGSGDPYPDGGGKNKIPPIPSTFTSGDELVDYGSEKTFNGYALSFKFSGKFANGGASFLVGKNSSDTNVVIITPQALKKVSDDSTLVANTTYTNEPVYFVASSIVNIQKFVLYTYPSFTNPVFSDCQFENGNTVTSYAPYSNICPISGWDGANVNVSGANLWDEEWELGNISTTNGSNIDASNKIRSKNSIKVKPSTSYANVGYALTVYEYDKDNAFISSSTKQVGSFTVGDNTYYIRFSRTATTYNNDISINYPSTDTTYHAHNTNSHTYSISWQTQCGILYGGYFEIFKDGGKWYCTVNTTHVTDVYDGDETWTYNSITNGFIHTIADMKSGSWYSDTKCICDKFKKISSGGEFGVRFGGANQLIYFNQMIGNIDGITTDADTWKTWLSSNNVTVVYPLATPETYTFEIDTEIATLLGNNNIFADCGDIEECRYVTGVL